MNFDRYSLFEGKTLAWRLFKRHHTHFNDIFWSSSVATRHSFSATTAYSKTDATGSLFPFTTGDRRIAPTLGQWAQHYSEFDSWMRMASIVAIAGYLETYIAQITTAALESNPSLIFGGGPKIDGTIYLKNNPKYGLFAHTEQFTKGTWQSRSSAFSRIFGSTPFTAHIPSLEKLRTLRNNAGHAFGRNIESMSFPKSWVVQRLPKIDDLKLQEHLKVIEKVALSIEGKLAPLVGQYEVIKAYHRWLPHSRNPRLSPKEVGKEFSVYFNKISGTPYGKDPAAALISYDNKL